MDHVPGMVTGALVAVSPALPGPTRDEWVGAAFGLVALAIRELVYWIRNRRA